MMERKDVIANLRSLQKAVGNGREAAMRKRRIRDSERAMTLAQYDGWIEAIKVSRQAFGDNPEELP